MFVKVLQVVVFVFSFNSVYLDLVIEKVFLGKGFAENGDVAVRGRRSLKVEGRKVTSRGLFSPEHHIKQGHSYGGF